MTVVYALMSGLNVFAMSPVISQVGGRVARRCPSSMCSGRRVHIPHKKSPLPCGKWRLVMACLAVVSCAFPGVQRHYQRSSVRPAIYWHAHVPTLEVLLKARALRLHRASYAYDWLIHELLWVAGSSSCSVPPFRVCASPVESSRASPRSSIVSRSVLATFSHFRARLPSCK
jgi:hypothetical protein